MANTSNTSANLENRPSFNGGNKPNFNKGNKPPFNRGNGSPFNKGNNRSFNGEGNHNQQNFRGPRNFNNRNSNGRPNFNDRNSNGRPNFNDRNSNGRPNFNNRNSNGRPDFNNRNSNGRPNFNNRNSNGKPNFNQKFNKPWQQDNDFQANDAENTVADNQNASANNPKNFADDVETNKNQSKLENQHIDNDPNNDEEDSEASESGDEIEAQPNSKKSESEESESEEEIEMQTSNVQNESDTSKSEEEVEKNANGKGVEISKIKEETESSDDSVEMDTGSNEKPQTKQKNDSGNFEKNRKPLREQRDRTIRIHHLPPIIKQAHLQKLFSKYGKIEKIMLLITSKPPLIKTLKEDVFGFVVFENSVDALKALEVHGMEYKGYHLEVNMYDNKTQYPPSHTIHIKHLPSDIERDTLWRTFESCGIIASVRIFRVKRCALVKFESADSVKLAILMNPVTIENQKIIICQKTEKKQRTPLGRRSYKQYRSPQRKFERPYTDSNTIQIQRDGFGGNSFTITLNNGGHQGSNFAPRMQHHRVRSGFVQKRRY